MNSIGSGRSSLKMWVKKTNPPTPFPASLGGERLQGLPRKKVGSGASSLKKWVKKTNPPTPFPTSVGGYFSPLLPGERLGERSSRLLGSQPQF